MKQVSLIIPKSQNPEPPGIFLGVLYLASYLKQKGIPVKIYDEQYDEATKHHREILDNSFLIGFSVMTVQLKSAKELSGFFHYKSDIPIVWGGAHPLLFPEQCLKENYVDFLTYDEAEETLYELASALQTGDIEYEKIKGIWYKKDHICGDTDFFKTDSRDYLDLNKIEPDWDLLKINRYDYQHFIDGKKQEVFPLHVGRGCIWKCAFCIHHCLNKRQHRPLTPNNIIKEIKRILAFKDVKNFIFVDDMFFIDFKRAKEFCKLYKENKFTFRWIATARVDDIIRMDDEFMVELKECGCSYMSMGIESGSQRVLDKIINKGIKVEEVIPAIEKLTKWGITPGCSFMIGMPGETIEEQNETFNLIKKIMKIAPGAHIMGPQLYRPYPGAELYQDAKRAGFDEPSSINSWINFINERGFLDISQLTWIPNRNRLLTKIEYFQNAQIQPKGLAKPVGLIFKKLFKLRILLDFYYWSIDIKIFKGLKNLYLQRGS